jgi:pterin-4a-carbinolamine dehydratase
MRRVSQIMNEYFEEDDAMKPRAPAGLLFERSDLPVKPDIMKWRVVTDPERFMRRFEFTTRSRLIDFLGEIFELEEELGHHGKLTIDHMHIDIEVHTKDLDCITELDIEYTKAIDMIFEDVQHYAYTGK